MKKKSIIWVLVVMITLCFVFSSIQVSAMRKRPKKEEVKIEETKEEIKTEEVKKKVEQKDPTGEIGKEKEILVKEIVIDDIENLNVPVYEYVSKVIIEGKWGTGPGEFGLRVIFGGLIEPDPSSIIRKIFPMCVTLDSKENIYILDGINERIQVFDTEGKYKLSIKLKGFPNYIIRNKNLEGDAREIAVDVYGQIFIKLASIRSAIRSSAISIVIYKTFLPRVKQKAA